MHAPGRRSRVRRQYDDDADEPGDVGPMQAREEKHGRLLSRPPADRANAVGRCASAPSRPSWYATRAALLDAHNPILLNVMVAAPTLMLALVLVTGRAPGRSRWIARNDAPLLYWSAAAFLA